jgi:phage tail tape-measure protein
MTKIEMSKIAQRVAANMDVVLEEVCRRLPHGGDHESRKHVAKMLMQAVKKGSVTLEELRPVASRAFSEWSKRKSA